VGRYQLLCRISLGELSFTNPEEDASSTARRLKFREAMLGRLQPLSEKILDFGSSYSAITRPSDKG